MTKLEELLEFHNIAQLKYRYLRALDTLDWGLMESCFSEDACAWYSGGQYKQTGRDSIIEFLKGVVTPDFYASHIAVHPEITFHSANSAEGIWRLQDIVHFTEANPNFAHENIQGGEEMVGAGYYHDEYVKENGEWKISSIGYIRIFEAIEPREHRGRYRVHVDPARGLQR